MSKDTSTSPVVAPNSHSRNPQDETKENEFENSLNSLHLPLPRTPLNSIPDPSQHRRNAHESDFSQKKLTDLDKAGISGALSNSITPRVLNRHGKAHMEPSSAQSTTARSGSRLSLGGIGASATGVRPAVSTRGKEVSSRLWRGNSITNSDYSVDVPHFELDEDPSFWSDHNVQVLIRIRPLSSFEKVSQGYGRCLRQESAHTLEWLGHPETRFTFDHIAGETISQEKLFKVAGLPMVENCMSGYNSCMFAYGQTGSGKTHTMKGEIKQIEEMLSEDSGITPRVFEYLFSRIRMEEESRRDEKLKFSCKCSFLEIYNEQITDLLEPSSTNLQLREDLKKGVYVENLTEYNVRNVKDVIKLLLQGAANRKIAATNMNSESSRSHSVFTCIIESCWEKDSMTHCRFARLNLVDLAGSERQKSSGAEGDRLREAANINKSLSTLGLVIMSLVDLAHEKQRHVPYRDSRLTFLLQDSLGGNSKTTVIANVSPSICSAHETLSTLKFAQRAKLIQNNAKVNEDASGDVGALHRQIQQLKDQLSFLMKHNNISSLEVGRKINSEESGLANSSGIHNYKAERKAADDNGTPNNQNKEMKRMKSALLGALRREKMAETSLQKLEAEIKHLNSLVCQREEDMQHTKMMLRFRDDKIKQLELLVNGSLSADAYLVEENKALKEEIHLLQSRIDRSPELTKFASQNMKLAEQLQLFQTFYEQGERETLLVEISDLRDQLLEALEREPKFSLRAGDQDNNNLTQMEDCHNMNIKLMREVDDLRQELGKYLEHGQAAFDPAIDYFSKDPEEIRHTDKYSMVESASISSVSGEETCFTHTENTVLNTGYQNKQNHPYVEILNKDSLERKSLLKVGSGSILLSLAMQKKGLIIEGSEDSTIKDLQAKLDKLTEEFEEAKLLNCQYQEDQASQLSHQHQVELVREQVEIETSRTILHLQDEITSLQLELSEKLSCMTKENLRLQNDIAAKEEEMRMLPGEWEKAIVELTSFLLEGSKSLKDASNQIENIVCSFPQQNDWICEHVERAARAFIDKEETILVLEKSLEDAQGLVIDLEMKLHSLKEATIALNLPHLDNDTSTNMLLNQKTNMIEMLERKLKLKEDQIIEAKKLADVAFLVVQFVSNRGKDADSNDISNESDNHSISKMNSDANSLSMEGVEAIIVLDGLLKEFINAIKASHRVLEADIIGFQMDLVEASATDMKLIQDLVKEIEEIKNNFVELKENGIGSQAPQSKLEVFEPVEFLEFRNQLHILHQIKDELAKINKRVKFIEDSIKDKVSACSSSLLTNECSTEADDWSVDESTSSYSTSGSDSSSEIVSLEKSHHGITVISCLRKELNVAFDTFNRTYARLSKFLDKHDITQSSSEEEVKAMALSSRLKMENDAACCHSINEVVTNDKVDHAGTFLDKCEAVHGIMKEADDMLNALLKANENATQLSGKWKQDCEELMVQRSCLVEENKQLKYSINLKERDCTLLLDELCCGMNEAATSLSSLEGCFLQMQKEMEDRYQILYSDIMDMAREMLSFICNSRSALEDICSELIEKEFFANVIYLYLVGEIHKIPCLNVQKSLYPFKERQFNMAMNYLANLFSSDQNEVRITSRKGFEDGNQSQLVRNLAEKGPFHDSLMKENSSLRKELDRKELLLKGLLFDFSLLQEVASSRKDIKDETEKLILTLNDVQQKLEMKTRQFDDLVVQHEEVESHLQDTENALRFSNFELEQAKEMINTLSDQNSELTMLLKDQYLKKSEAEEKLEEQKEVIKGLENQIIHFTSLVDRRYPSSVESLEENLRKITDEREQLREEIQALNDKLHMAYALVDENEAIAVEARQDSEASKIYAEQKEEEVKILEHSVEELECTINVLEKRVYEMDEEVEKQRLIRDSLEVELQALRQRLSTVGNFTDSVDSEDTSPVDDKDTMSRQLQTRILELTEARNQIKLLENSIAEKDKEIKQCKEYASEVVLHSEAQALQYQEKYKALEAMILEVKTNISNPASVEPTVDKFEKSSMRTRGSSSPFRCIASLVQQMNLEKDQELSAAMHRIEELEGMLAARQKDVCMLNARLAAAESMTHDVIRDLLGVKLDMTNYANLIDQHQVQNLVKEAYQQKEEFLAKEHEIMNLRKQIDDLVGERESCMSELKRKGADVLAVQMTLEQLQERGQLFSAQNEMLKVDRSNLLKRVAELDEMVKTLLGRQTTHQRVQQTQKTKEKGMSRLSDADLTEKLDHSESLLTRVNNELAVYRRASISHPHVEAYGRGFETRQRK